VILNVIFWYGNCTLDLSFFQKLESIGVNEKKSAAQKETNCHKNRFQNFVPSKIILERV